MIFLSGRLVALFLLLAFQICLVRILAPHEYATYALFFAIAALMQTALSLGIPRIIPKFVTRAGWSLANSVVMRLVEQLIAVRTGASALTLAVGMAIAVLVVPESIPTVHVAIVAGAFIVATVIQLDLDAVAQALKLQRLSRNVLGSEALIRLVLVVALATLNGLHTAIGVLGISLATSIAASTALFLGVRARLGNADHDEGEVSRTIDRSEFWRTARGGYASALAWFASSPAIIRLLAAMTLRTATFAGFAFTQALVLSVQRYTPAMLLFPFIEPTVMRDYHRSGDRSRLQSALSLIGKIDAIVIGAGLVATIVAAPTILDHLTAGRYTALAFTLPFLLLYIATNSVYRAFEIVAVALGTTFGLVSTLAISLVWLSATIPLAVQFGLPALLLCPLGDALTRLLLMHRNLRRQGIRHVFDVPVMAGIVALVLIFGIGGREIAAMTSGPLAPLLIAAAATLVFLAMAAVIRPFREGEIKLLDAHAPQRATDLVRRYLKRH